MKTINQIGQFSMLLLLLVTGNLVSGQYEHYLDSLRSNELYEYVEGTGSQQFLAKGNSEQALLQLEQPILYYGVKYQQIYVSSSHSISDRCDNKVAIAIYIPYIFIYE